MLGLGNDSREDGTILPRLEHGNPEPLAQDETGGILGVAELKQRAQRRLPEILFVSAMSASLVAVAVAVIQFIESSGLLLTSVISSAVLIVTAPNMRQCHPARVSASHAIAMAVGLGAHLVMPTSPLAIAAAVAISLAIVLLLDAFHPPAMANAAFPFVVGHATPIELLGLVVGGAVVLSIASLIGSQFAAKEHGQPERMASFWLRRRGG